MGRQSSSPPLYEQVYLTLRTSILAGEFNPGDRLKESQLAQQLQVSRTPVREAIRRLQQEQLLANSPTGITIFEISLDSAIHLYDCRIALEQLAVEGACCRITPQQLQALEQNLRASQALGQRRAEAALPVQLQLMALNYDFHRLIAESSGNPWLVSLLDQLSNQVKLLRLRILQTPVDGAAIQAEHWQLLQAIVQRDVDEAKDSIRSHLELSKQRVVEVFRSSQAAHHHSLAVTCPRCGYGENKKNGRRQGRQNYQCKRCGRQFVQAAVS